MGQSKITRIVLAFFITAFISLISFNIIAATLDDARKAVRVKNYNKAWKIYVASMSM